MKPYFPIAVFFLLLFSTVFSSYCCYETQYSFIQKDADRALAMTLRRQRSDAITPDTVTVYRSNIAIAEIRDTAAISVKAVTIGDRHVTVVEADAGCTFLTVLRLSDQRLPSVLLFLTALWTAVVLWHRRRHPFAVVPIPCPGISFGGMTYDIERTRFYSEEGTEIRFTPMQHRLMEMFFLSESHSLPKQQICDALWPKKPDASETLYTLVRRLKPIVERYSSLHIEADRGRAYVLTNSDADA
ncbi:MAG: winged helix-turn-helix domain-containing protein [Bacteroidales bacterium]|nr:winged helix-turn-helix domain-containing protein [Bacteroidales bacterium]MCM1147200.1 winged helix-turn-helix domain-containing protein [Bacteroidales bacterium]MCM1205426.1 winged helix-turn-helix domain-containing protein [Bacillota bacterium]MCM1509769.1 winged helix-turn-helix domain-containing protein [Clostridium sp.]